LAVELTALALGFISYERLKKVVITKASDEGISIAVNG